MTTFGKILAVFCLLFSLGVGALLILFHVTSTPWRVAVNKWQVAAELAQADVQAYKSENDGLLKEKNALTVELQKMAAAKPADNLAVQVSKLRDEIAVKDQQVKSLTASNDALEKSLIAANKKNAEYDAIIKAHQVADKQTLDDKNRLKTLLQEEVKANTDLRIAANKAREDKVAAEIRATALEETNKQLTERAQDLVKENARLAKQLQTGSTGLTGVTTLSLSAPNPPAFAIDLKVLGADDGLVEISGGSDAGLQKGHTLDVFRLSPKSQYLCMIRLITVEPHKSVGQIVGKPVMPVQRGDNVASKILGN
jgi:hypothetical protein